MLRCLTLHCTLVCWCLPLLQVKCDAAGSAFTSLYLGNDCQVLLGTGRGVGDGVTCGVIRFTDGSGPWSGYVDCSAPGPDPGKQTTSLCSHRMIMALASLR